MDTTLNTVRAHSYPVLAPLKIWQPKPKDRYIQLDYGNEIDNDLFLFPACGHAVTHARKPPVTSDRSDIRHWDAARDTAKFTADLRIGSAATSITRGRLEHLIQQYWDCFYKEGASKPVIGFTFAIDTGGSPPICCRRPRYGVHESPVIMAHIRDLLANGWITECQGPWGSMIVLAAKPHQGGYHPRRGFCLAHVRLLPKTQLSHTSI